MPTGKQADGSGLDEIVDAFEVAWQSGKKPAIDEFLPADPGWRRDALVKLVHIDLEYRLQAGEEARVEAYLTRYAELSDGGTLALALISWEFTLRRRREHGLTEEYQRRFPQFPDLLHEYLSLEPADEQETLPAITEVRADHSLPSLPGYETLGELGRGGMGVVYKAQDRAGAMEAWSRKCVVVKDGQKLLVDPRYLDSSGIAMIHAIILASLTGKLTEDEAAEFQQRLMGQLPAEYRTILSALHIRLSAALLLDMWRTPHALASARHIAYQDVPLDQYLKLHVLVGATGLIRRDAFGPEISSAQDDLIWQLADSIWTVQCNGKFSQTNMVQLGLSWKGTTNFLGWGGLAPSLDAPLRGPLALVLGHRYLRLGQPAQAAEFFRTAQRDAVAGSNLGKLSDIELKKLAPK